jgi:transcriptional regulator with XRE-family HTH domain
VSSFPEKLRQAMHEKRCKPADVAKAMGISPSVVSRYLSERNKPSFDNIIAISHYLNVSPEWLLSSSDAPDSTKKSRVISSATEPLEEQIKLQKKMIKFLEKRVDGLEKEVKAWEDMATKISGKNSQKTKHPINPNKQKMGFLKKHKPKK